MFGGIVDLHDQLTLLQQGSADKNIQPVPGRFPGDQEADRLLRYRQQDHQRLAEASSPTN